MVFIHFGENGFNGILPLQVFTSILFTNVTLALSLWLCALTYFCNPQGMFPQVSALENVEWYIAGNFRGLIFKLLPSWPLEVKAKCS